MISKSKVTHALKTNNFDLIILYFNSLFLI